MKYIFSFISLFIGFHALAQNTQGGEAKSYEDYELTSVDTLWKNVETKIENLPRTKFYIEYSYNLPSANSVLTPTANDMLSSDGLMDGVYESGKIGIISGQSAEIGLRIPLNGFNRNLSPAIDLGTIWSFSYTQTAYSFSKLATDPQLSNSYQSYINRTEFKPIGTLLGSIGLSANLYPASRKGFNLGLSIQKGIAGSTGGYDDLVTTSDFEGEYKFTKSNMTSPNIVGVSIVFPRGFYLGAEYFDNYIYNLELREVIEDKAISPSKTFSNSFKARIDLGGINLRAGIIF